MKKPLIEKIALETFRKEIATGMYEKVEAVSSDLRLTGLSAHEGTRDFYLAAGRSEKFQKVWAEAYSEAVAVGLDRNSAAIADEYMAEFARGVIEVRGQQAINAGVPSNPMHVQPGEKEYHAR